jgi:hypothetical protein
MSVPGESGDVTPPIALPRLAGSTGLSASTPNAVMIQRACVQPRAAKYSEANGVSPEITDTTTFRPPLDRRVEFTKDLNI